jgi:phosphoglycerate dehydrogenase-like enzyme
MTMPTLLLGFEPDELAAEQRRQIEQLAPHLKLLQTTDRQTIEEALADIEIAVRRFPTDLLAQAPNLRWYQQWGAGADWLLNQPALVASDLVITTGSGIHAIPITEHIIAMLLAFARGLPQAIRQQGGQVWRAPEWEQLFELPGRTMLLIGVGAIGEQTAKVATALGMRVVGVRRDPSIPAAGVDEMYGSDQLLDLLPQADVVVLTAPLTPETHHLIGPAELTAMKTSAILINIGRGGTIDESALIQALQEGRIAGAGLDVFAKEPLPPDSPLWGMENVIVTAHYAGATPVYDDRAMAIFLANLRRYLAGEPLQNVVDKTLGY